MKDDKIGGVEEGAIGGESAGGGYKPEVGEVESSKVHVRYPEKEKRRGSDPWRGGSR